MNEDSVAAAGDCLKLYREEIAEVQDARAKLDAKAREQEQALAETRRQQQEFISSEQRLATLIGQELAAQYQGPAVTPRQTTAEAPSRQAKRQPASKKEIERLEGQLKKNSAALDHRPPGISKPVPSSKDQAVAAMLAEMRAELAAYNGRAKSAFNQSVQQGRG